VSEQTEAPTPRRLQRARQQGDVAVSGALLQALGLAVAVALAPSAIGAVATRATELLRGVLQSSQPPMAALSPSQWLRETVQLSAPILIAVACAVAFAGMVQTRGLLAPARLSPSLARMSALALFRSLFSPQRAFAVMRSLGAACAVAFLVARRLRDHMPDLARSAGRLSIVSLVSGELAKAVARDVVLVMLALAAVDLVVTHRGWWMRLRMTRGQVQREQRESEGDPHIKAARERAYQELIASATVHAVKDATVVIINPTRLASALRYRDGEDDAPVLIANGEGELARRIVEAARMYGIPVVQDIPVAQALAQLRSGDSIPPSLYEAVAAILQELGEHDAVG
jgi:flagellar biosynthesis protein FlhB